MSILLAVFDIGQEWKDITKGNLAMLRVHNLKILRIHNQIFSEQSQTVFYPPIQYTLSKARLFHYIVTFIATV